MNHAWDWRKSYIPWLRGEEALGECTIVMTQKALGSGVAAAPRPSPTPARPRPPRLRPARPRSARRLRLLMPQPTPLVDALTTISDHGQSEANPVASVLKKRIIPSRVGLSIPGKERSKEHCHGRLAKPKCRLNLRIARKVLSFVLQ